MADNLRQQTKKSIVWSMIDKFGFQLIGFLIGIITMKLILPYDFGLVKTLLIITMLSNIFVDSGFTAALVRRQNTKNCEYTSVFYFNIAIAIVLYAGLTLLFPSISRFYEQPELVNLGQFLFLCIIINSLGIIPNILLIKSLSFKQISLASLIAAFVAGVVVIWLAICGLGYWALAWQIILQNAVRVVIIWFFSKWKPSKKPAFGVIKELFAFSSILLLTSTVSTCIKYLYTMLIGKQYSMNELGQYGQADKFQQIPSTILSGMSSVAYPVFAKLNNEKERQLLYFRKIVRITAFLIFPMMFGLIGIAKNFILVCIDAVWLPSVPYLQILSVSAMFLPFQSLCLQMLNAIGKPKWNFYLEMFRNLLIIISLAICIISVKFTFSPFSFDIKFFENNRSISLFLIGFSAVSFLAYLTNILVIGKFIKYSLSEHLRDVLPYFAISAVMCALIVLIGTLTFNIYLIFVLQCAVGAGFYFGISALLGSQVLKDAFNMVRGNG